jgi:hypothetical protein
MRKSVRIALQAVCFAGCLAKWPVGPSHLAAAAFPGDPNQAAWALFTSINQPASDGLASLWENWAQASDLFTAYPATPVWPSSPANVKKLEPLEQDKLLLKFDSANAAKMHILRAPIDVTANSEVHINCPTFSFVVSSNLWNTNGLMTRAADIAAGRAQAIEFPPDSVAVKAKWRKYDPSKDNLAHYHSASDSAGTKWLLVGLHVTSKVQPNWLWATWEQQENDSRPASTDTFGYPAGATAPSPGLAQMFKQNNLRAEWAYYRLDGSQTDFLSPKLLGNSTIETGFLSSSSCMTCHNRAGRFSDNSSISFLDSQGNGFVGIPLASSFTAPGKVFMPMDFLWSMADRANYYGPKVIVAPPPDCTNIH